jgi:hypothetical protein
MHKDIIIPSPRIEIREKDLLNNFFSSSYDPESDPGA